MYLVSWTEQDARLEASLGGRVDADEMIVFFEEMQEIVDSIEGQPFLLVLDYSRAKNFDRDASAIVNDLKDFCLRNGAEHIVNVVKDDADVPSMTNARLQFVLEGTEDFVTDPSAIKWTPPQTMFREQRHAA